MKAAKKITAWLLGLSMLCSTGTVFAVNDTDVKRDIDVKKNVELMELVRANDFEKFVPGAVCSGSVVFPTDGEVIGKGVPSEDGSTWLYELDEDKSGGWGFSLNDGLKGNLVRTKAADGTDTKALQILRPDKVKVNNAKFVMNPTESFSAARLIYSVDMRNGGKSGASADDAGYTNEINNFFGSVSLLGFTIDFNRQAVIFNANPTASPAVLNEEAVEFAAPKNGEWFKLRAEVDAIESTIAVYINDRKIGEKYYGGAFSNFTANALSIALTSSKEAENAFYIDNVEIKRSAKTADELKRIFEEKTFREIGYPYIVYPGSLKYYFADKVDYFSTDGSQTPLYVGDEIYLPIRCTAGLYGYAVEWDSADGSINLKGEKNIRFKESGTQVTINGEISNCSMIYFAEDYSYFAAKDAARIFGKELYSAPSGITLLMEPGAAKPTMDQEKKIVSLYPDAALGFEVENSWFTYPDLCAASGAEEYQLNINWGSNGRDNIGTSYEAQRYGVTQSIENVKSGRYSGLWKDHHFYPTIMTSSVPSDISAYTTISFWIYSEAATGEHVTLGLASNPYDMYDYESYKMGEYTMNFFYDEFNIDFTGWKKFTFPLQTLKKSSDAVAGFGKIDALYFFTRAFDYEPYPQTVLYIDDITLETHTEALNKLETEENLKLQAAREAAQEAEHIKDFVLDVPDIFRAVTIPDYDKLLETKKKLTRNPSDPAAKKTLDEIHAKYSITGDNYTYPDLVVTGKSKIYAETVENNEELPIAKLNLGHKFPEIMRQPEKGEPIITWAYFKEARAMYGYNPKFLPTFTNVIDGFKFMVYASLMLEYADEDGNWHFYDWSKQMERYCEETLGFETYRLRTGGYYNETKLRYDNDGDVYQTIMIQGTYPDGNDGLFGILCHSRDKMKTWDFYKLPRPFTKMEILDGNNTDCLKRPPVIMLHNYWSSPDKSGAFVIPEKQPDGTLIIPEETVYCQEPVICTSQHSGKANFAATSGDKVFMTFGICYEENRTDERYQAALSFMPKGHSMRKLMEEHPDMFASPVGVPTFIIEYDIIAKTLSEPVFLGYAGHVFHDAHNWSSISLDSEGCIHAFLIGHHFPLVYCKSKKPADISEWEPVEYIGAKTSISYASMNIDKNDTLYTITRDSTDSYHFDQVLYRKKKGGEWERIKMLKYWKGSYMIWGTDMYMDPDTGALYINYRSKTDWQELFADDWAAKDFIWPEQSEKMTDIAPEGVDYPYFGGHYANTGSKPRGEHINVVTYDGGDTWRLATTEDYMR